MYYVVGMRSMSVVCQINCVGGITWPTRMLKVFFFAVKPVTPVLFISYTLEMIKANRTSETEEQRKERLRIRREKDRARRRTKGKKRSPSQTITRNSAWPLLKD